MSLLKIMLLGEIQVGKTSLVHRLIDQKFTGDYKSTMNVDIFPCTLQTTEGEADCAIWDMDGDISESALGHTYMMGASGALIIGDATRPETWRSMGRIADAFAERHSEAPTLFVVNKSDLANPNGDSLRDALKLQSPPLLTSALTGQAVSTAFSELAATIIRRRRS